MPKLPCCTKASFYAKSAFLLLKASLYANCFAQTTLVKYTHNAAIGKTILRETYGKRSNDLGVAPYWFYDRVIPSSMYREQRYRLLSFLCQNFMLLGSPLDYSRDIRMTNTY